MCSPSTLSTHTHFTSTPTHPLSSRAAFTLASHFKLIKFSYLLKKLFRGEYVFNRGSRSTVRDPSPFLLDSSGVCLCVSTCNLEMCFIRILSIVIVSFSSLSTVDLKLTAQTSTQAINQSHLNSFWNWITGNNEFTVLFYK